MELKELYAKKGELVTQIEVLQLQLQQVNQSLAKELNKPVLVKDDKPIENKKV